MPVLLIAALMGSLLGLGLGGRFSGLSVLRLRWRAIPFAAVLSQVASLAVPPSARPAIALVSQTVVLGWLGANMAMGQNKHIRFGGRLLAFGAVLNSIPMMLHGGMPVSSNALAVAGMPANFDVSNGNLGKHVTAASDAAFGFLGDIIPLRGLHVVLSFGDLVMAWGLALVVGAAMMAMPRRPGLRVARPGGPRSFGNNRPSSVPSVR